MREQTVSRYLMALNGAYSGINNSPFTMSLVGGEEPTEGYVVNINKLANWPSISSVSTAAMVGDLRVLADKLDNELLYITSINSADGAEFYVSIIIDNLNKAKNIARIHNQDFIIELPSKNIINCQVKNS